jgi:hypothetical protein
MLVARIAIGDAARREAARVRPLPGCRCSAPAPQCDEGAPERERERENTEILRNRHSDDHRCKLLAAASGARSEWVLVTLTTRATMDEVDQKLARPLHSVRG